MIYILIVWYLFFVINMLMGKLVFWFSTFYLLKRLQIKNCLIDIEMNSVISTPEMLIIVLIF